MYEEIAEKLKGGDYSIGEPVYRDGIYNSVSIFFKGKRIGICVTEISLVEYYREIAISKFETVIELNDGFSVKELVENHAHELVQQLGCKVVVR